MQRQENDDRDQSHDTDDEDAAFGASSSSAEDRFTDGVRGEEMMLDHYSAVGDSVEKRLRPVP